MKVLFVVGYQKKPFNPFVWIEEGIGGSEYAVIKLAHQMSKQGDEVVVTGQVSPCEVEGIKYIPYELLGTNQHYDIVIATNYIHYINELDAREITFDKSYFWIHNNEYYAYWNGQILEDFGKEHLQNSRMTNVIAVSDYSAKLLEKKYPEMVGKVRVIPNAIDPTDWNGIRFDNKQKNKFVYTSAADRGLKNLLEIWPQIREARPEATLWVATPPYGLDWYEDYKGFYDGVHFEDNLPPRKLYELIASSEYWVYPSQYDETYCITALEMMMGEVSIITTDTGNLASIIPARGAMVSSESDVETLKKQILEKLEFVESDAAFRKFSKENAKSFVLKQTWENVEKIWRNLMNETQPNRQEQTDMLPLHPELYSYKYDKIGWLERFVTYDARIREWDLISDEQFDGCFTFPLFTGEFCKMIREEAEHSKKWTYKRHEYYPTTDMLLSELGLNEIYYEVLQTYVMQFMIYKFGLEGKGWDSLGSENFLARYTPDTQGHLSIHHDAADLTCLVQLSDLDEYEGGGTWFWRQKKLIKGGIGYCTIHPGNITHKHGARPVSKGSRYIIVSFMKNLERY